MQYAAERRLFRTRHYSPFETAHAKGCPGRTRHHPAGPPTRVVNVHWQGIYSFSHYLQVKASRRKDFPLRWRSLTTMIFSAVRISKIWHFASDCAMVSLYNWHIDFIERLFLGVFRRPEACRRRLPGNVEQRGDGGWEMEIICPNCGIKRSVDDKVLPQNKTRITTLCRSCGHRFVLHLDHPQAFSTSPAPEDTQEMDKNASKRKSADAPSQVPPRPRQEKSAPSPKDESAKAPAMAEKIQGQVERKKQVKDRPQPVVKEKVRAETVSVDARKKNRSHRKQAATPCRRRSQNAEARTRQDHIPTKHHPGLRG